MLINFSPVRMDEKLEASLSGEALTLNGEVFDFAPLEDGATLPQEAISSKWIAGPVERVGGELRLTIILPHGPNAPDTTRYPQPVTVTQDGVVDLPVYDIPVAPEAENALIIRQNSTGKEYALPTSLLYEVGVDVSKVSE